MEKGKTMEERFEYYDLWKCVYAYDTQTSTIVYFKDKAWHEECNMTHHELEMNDMGLRISEKWAMDKTKGSHPLPFVEELIEQETLKSIYCP